MRSTFLLINIYRQVQTFGNFAPQQGTSRNASCYTPTQQRVFGRLGAYRYIVTIPPRRSLALLGWRLGPSLLLLLPPPTLRAGTRRTRHARRRCSRRGGISRNGHVRRIPLVMLVQPSFLAMRPSFSLFQPPTVECYQSIFEGSVNC